MANGPANLALQGLLRPASRLQHDPEPAAQGFASRARCLDEDGAPHPVGAPNGADDDVIRDRALRAPGGRHATTGGCPLIPR
jgi:hypothetical protein